MGPLTTDTVSKPADLQRDLDLPAAHVAYVRCLGVVFCLERVLSRF